MFCFLHLTVVSSHPSLSSYGCLLSPLHFPSWFILIWFQHPMRAGSWWGGMGFGCISSRCVFWTLTTVPWSRHENHQMAHICFPPTLKKNKGLLLSYSNLYESLVPILLKYSLFDDFGREMVQFKWPQLLQSKTINGMPGINRAHRCVLFNKLLPFLSLLA